MPLASCFNKRWVDFSRAVGTTLYQYVYQFYHSEQAPPPHRLGISVKRQHLMIWSGWIDHVLASL